jgi:small neutral amino acid transporter SnatA (MarC family)
MVVFELILLKSEKVITIAKQNIILIVYAIAMFCMFFFLFIPGYGVTLNLGTGWSPVWSFPFFIYLVIIESLAIIPSILFAFQIYAKFEDKLLKKKWRYFIYGFFALLIFMYGIFVSNYLANSTFRLIMGIMGLILAISGGYLMYKGVGKQLEK